MDRVAERVGLNPGDIGFLDGDKDTGTGFKINFASNTDLGLNRNIRVEAQ